jgi:hypothetical protein
MKLAAALLWFAAAGFAYPWDGIHEDLNIVTVDVGTSIFGVFALPSGEMPPRSVEILVSSTDKTVTAFRVVIEYTDATGLHTDSRTGSVGALMTMAFFGGITSKQITSVTVTRLHNGQTTSIKATG